MYNFMLKIMIGLFLSLSALAANNNKPSTELGAGKVAENLLGPLGLLSDLISTLAFVIGASFLFASLIKYIEHRRSPLMVPISTVVYLFFVGLLLLLLPFVSYITESGLPYSLMNTR